MGLLDSITPGVGALGAGLMGFLGGQSTNEQNAEIARENNAWSAHQFATRYQTTVKDLEAAGLNPMLAYSQGGGSPPTAQQVQFQNPVSSAMDAYSAVRGGESKAAQAYSSAGHADASARQADAATTKIIEETKNVSDQGVVLRMTAQELTARATLMAQQGATEQQRQEMFKQTINNLIKDGKLKQLDVNAAESLGNLGRESKELAPAVNVLLRLLSK